MLTYSSKLALSERFKYSLFIRSVTCWWSFEELRGRSSV